MCNWIIYWLVSKEEGFEDLGLLGLWFYGFGWYFIPWNAFIFSLHIHKLLLTNLWRICLEANTIWMLITLKEMRACHYFFGKWKGWSNLGWKKLWELVEQGKEEGIWDCFFRKKTFYFVLIQRKSQCHKLYFFIFVSFSFFFFCFFFHLSFFKYF